ncbi:uncharacterized protein [Temnothorax longispinosus]|uniref:uncharacterized protein n=1 Tax=Temnothorax longispinosus TaxID=300112 RepID=UPI003A9A51CF
MSKKATTKETVIREMEGIIRSQHDLHGRIARSYDNLKKMGSTNITIGLVEARLQALDANWAKFEAQHDKLFASFWESLTEHDYEKRNVPATVEEAYLVQKGMFLETLRKLKSKLASEAPGAAPASQPSRTTLPRIQLPEFTGKYEAWPAFRDLFHSIIEKDGATTSVEKLHYLKSCLKDEAELLVRSLPTTDENFDRAWKTLTDYYENKRLLVRSYISQFTSLQKLKGESVSDLRKLYHCVMSTAGALDNIGRPISRSEDLFVHLIVDLLDPRSRREWENAISETSEPPSYSDLQQFLDRRLHTLESLQPVKTEGASSAKAGGNSAQQTRALHAKKQENKLGRCSMCQKGHFIMFCAAYKGKTAAERKQHIESSNLCFNCLGKHKLSECASTRTCSVCDARHHTSLHDAYSGGEVAKTSHLAQKTLGKPVAVLLATARIRVRDCFGIEHTARALVDQGSESSLVSESLVQRLKLSRAPTSVAVFGVGGKRTGRAQGLLALDISPRDGGPAISVSALILPRLTLYGGGVSADRATWPHLRELELADPDFAASDPVEILLGADVFAAILQPGLLKGEPFEPVAQRTTLGWIISGAAGQATCAQRSTTLQCHITEDLSSIVKRFWQQEELPGGVLALTPEDRECENFFSLTHSRTADGRYMVRLPVVDPLPDLKGTRGSAL